MIIAVYNTLFRIYGLAFFVPIALNYAYLPASSFAFGKSDFKRVLWLTFHVVWICIVWGLIITFITVCFPDQISKIWSKNDRFEYWSKQLMPRVFYTFTLLSLKFIMISYLQSTHQSIKAMLLSIFTELLGLPIFATCFHYTGDKNSPQRLFYAYNVNDTVALIVCLCVSGPSMIKLYKTNKELDNSDDECKVIQEL